MFLLYFIFLYSQSQLPMNLLKIDGQIKSFKDKIVKTFKLQNIDDSNILKQKAICKWITEQYQKLKKNNKQELNQSGINKIFAGVVNKFMKADESIKQNIEKDLKNLVQCIRKKKIPNQFIFQSKNIPNEIVSLVNEMKNKKWEEFYGQVQGPLIDSMIIMKKQDFHTNVELVKVNGLKIMMIQEKVAHRYQRNLIQEIFGRVFRSQGSLSTVIKIQVNHLPLQPAFNLFCYIEDRQFIDEDNSYKNLADLQIYNSQLQISSNDQVFQVNQINILQLFLAEILVLPVQSLVSDFVIKIDQTKQDSIQIIKCNQQDQQQIVKQTSLRQHSSLRNPLLYFSSYIREHHILISKAKTASVQSELYACFYRCLEIVIKLMLSDFQTHLQDRKINSSICFNFQVFQSLWIIFHKICLLSSWMVQVIEPVKKAITIGQIITHFCPIYNQISLSCNNAENFTAYKQFSNNVEMESYLGTIVSKKALQKYKDIFLNESQVILNKKYDNSIDLYNQIFSPILEEANLEYLDPIESSYILYFYCKYKFVYQPFAQDLQQKWKSQSLWTKCTKCLTEQSNSKSGEIPFIDIGFDFLAFACDINVYQIDDKCFERVKNFQENQRSIQGINKFISFIREKHQKMSEEILSSLLEKSLKHKKFKVSRMLLEKKVRIRNFHQIIAFHQIIDQMDDQCRKILVKAIQERSPQMHRLFKWQELMLVNLQKQCKQSVKIQTVDFGTIFIPLEVLKTHIKNGKVSNNLSRKDYRFNSHRQIALVSYKCGNGKNVSFYIQKSQYPLMSYFYRFFLKNINTPEIMPYFTSFFYENMLFHLVECMDNSFSYNKGLTNFKQIQLNVQTDQNLIAEAILISMIILPSRIQSRDIILCPIKQAEQDQIFVVDWHSFYCKDFMQKQSGKVVLNSKNVLFLMQSINKSINKKLINKFSWIQIQKIGENVMQQCMVLNKKINEMRNIHCKEQQFMNKKQLLALVFEQGFLFSITERMYKIKRAFNKKNNVEKGISFLKLLQILNSSTCYYYEQIFNSKETFLERQKILFNQNSKRHFLQTNLVQFFGAFSRLQQKDNIFPLHYDRFCFEGPTQNLASAGTNMKKFLVFKSTEIPHNLADFPNDIFEYYMRYNDLTGFDNQKKQKLVQIIKLKSRQHIDSKERRVLPLSYIGIKSMDFIKQKNLANDFSFERVQQLLVESCKLGEYELNYFPKTIENILYLHLNGITGLKYVGENVIYGKTIQIRHLKTLSIIDCNDIISINIKCDILENLQLRNNKNMEVINVFSLNLKNIYLFNMPSLLIQNIGIYIIKGINVLGCNSSCHGDLIKLYADDYETYISYVIRYLIIKFFESNDSRYWIIFTLLQLKQLDQSLYAKAGFSNFKAVSVVFKQFSNDVEDKVLVELLRLYIGNPYRRRVCINDLIQNSNSSTSKFNIERLLKLLNEAISKSNSVKSITQIKFDNTKLFFNNVNSQNIKTMIDRLMLDKNLTLRFQNLRQEAQGIDAQDKKTLGRQMDSIRYISVEKPDIQKITLVFKNSYIKESMLESIFKDTKSISQIIKQEESSQRSGFSKVKSSSVRQSLKQMNCNYMKINHVVLEGCTIVNDKCADLKGLEVSLKQIQKKIEKQQEFQLSLQSICKTVMHFTSVKHLKLVNCILEDFSFLQNFQNLNALSICKCNIKAKKTKKEEKPNDVALLRAYLELYKILITFQINSLELENFFIVSNQTESLSKLFGQFCISLKRMRNLKQLRLNKNYFSVQNLRVLQNSLNDTTIQQLQLEGMSFQNEKNLTSTIQEQQKSKNNLQIFSTLFQKCKQLKSLTIQINNQSALQQFIISISKNQYLMELKLQSNYQILSTMLKPLNQNKQLSFMSSNVQLPVWLINHIRQNSHNRRKSRIQPEDQPDTKDDPMNTTLSFGSINSLKSNNDYFKIGLSLDGGGVRGMLLATQLNYLATRVGYPLHKIFDCIGGTSIGGILALASSGTLDGYNPVADTEQLMLLFSKYGKDIFKKTQIMQLRNLFDTKYSADSFEGLLKNYFKDCRLSNCLTETNVIVTAVNRVDNKDYIFRSMDALLNRDRDFYMRDVARATSAAPTYFPSAQIKNINASMKLSLVDGGVGLNNPSKLVIDEVKKMSANSGLIQNYFLLSLGTGKLPSEVIPEYAGLKDLAPIIDSFTQSAAYFVERDLATNYKGHFFRVSPLINVKVKKDAELDNTSDSIIQMYQQTGLEAAKKHFESTVIFGKYRNLNLIQWLRQNTVRKYQY